MVHGHLGGRPPKVDLDAERLLAEILLAGSRDGMVSAAHDLSEGGLAQTLVEMCLVGEVGARIVLPESADPFVQLFSESAARVVVAVPRTEELRFTEMCTARSQPWTRIGVVDAVDPAGHQLDIQGVARLALTDLRAAWEGTLPALFGARRRSGLTRMAVLTEVCVDSASRSRGGLERWRRPDRTVRGAGDRRAHAQPRPAGDGGRRQRAPGARPGPPPAG